MVIANCGTLHALTSVEFKLSCTWNSADKHNCNRPLCRMGLLGKAWCQYFCPMAPVQTILTGQRGAFGTPAHIGNTSKITQSMCRSVSQLGKEQSACVACQSSCIDIDSERHYWQQIKGKRGLTWAWYSYPGLILVFFKIMNSSYLESLIPRNLPVLLEKISGLMTIQLLHVLYCPLMIGCCRDCLQFLPFYQ